MFPSLRSLVEDFPVLSARALSSMWVAPYGGASPFANGAPWQGHDSVTGTVAGASSAKNLIRTSGIPAPTVGSTVNGRVSAYFDSTATDTVAFNPSQYALTAWFEDATDFGGANWPSNASIGTSGSRPALTMNNAQPTVSTVSYNGHHPPAFDGVTEDFWGTPSGSILMSDLVTASYGEIHFLIDTDGPLAAPAGSGPYDDANPWSDGGATLTMGFNQNNPGTGGEASAYAYDGAYKQVPSQTCPTGTVVRCRMIWDGVNLSLYMCTASGVSTSSSVACGPVTSLTGSLTMGTARTLWWGPGRILSWLSSKVPLGGVFDAGLAAYWNTKYGLSLI